MLFPTICGFFDAESRWTERRALTVAAVSPSARVAVLHGGGFRLGNTTFGLCGDHLHATILFECATPPIEWWDYRGDVAISSSDSLQSACGFILAIKNNWGRCQIKSVELKEGEELSHEKQAAVFPCLERIQSEVVDLRLSDFSLSDESNVPVLEGLRCLFLTNCDGPVQQWCAVLNTHVERVEICDTTAFTDASFAGMRPSSWQRLVLDNTNVSNTNIKQLTCARTLRTLSLIDCRRVDALEAGDFPELRLLLLGRTPISSDSLTGIERCRHLKLVNLGGCHGITDISVFGELKSLRELFVHETALTNHGIRGLEKCESLEKLNLGGCVSISNVSHLGCLLALKELHLWRTRVTNAGIQGLGTCHSLAELVLDDCVHVTDVSSLGRLTSLRWLSLIGTEVDARGIRELIHCGALETLALAGTQLVNPPKLWRHDAVIQYLSSL